VSRRDLAAYAATLWAFVFALPSFIWAAGVRTGSEAIAADVEEAGIADPALGADAVRWHLLLWDPWWLLGGILFALGAWQFTRAERAEAAGASEG
jgi:hypothetical protein